MVPALKHFGGVILALGLLCLGLAMPKMGWQALSERLPEWMPGLEGSLLVGLVGVALIVAGEALERRDRLREKRQEPARDASLTLTPKVWCMSYPGIPDVFAAYIGADDSPEGRRKRMRAASKNKLGHQLQADDFPSVLHAMVDPPDALQDYCTISGQVPMVSPRLQSLLKTLDLGNGGFYEAEFYSEDGVNRLPWSHAFWNIGTTKESFLPEESDVSRITNGRNDPLDLYVPRGGLLDDTIAVGPEAVEGPDVWFEPKLAGHIFFSERFARLMEDHGMLYLFDLKSVRVIRPE